MQFEDLSDNAKLLIELVRKSKNFKLNTSNLADDWFRWNRIEEHNTMIIFNSCLLLNIPNEFNNILQLCKSKNYWLDSK